MITLSVVIATYNGEKYLQEQLNSIVSQTHKVDEIIITDDSSTDSTPKILNDFYQKYSHEVNIKILYNKCNLGYTKNFEIGLMHVTSNFVLLCDQDDIWYKSKVERLIGVIDNSPDFLVYMNDVLLVDEKLNTLNVTKLALIGGLKLTYKSYVMGAASIIRTDFLRYMLPFPDIEVSHDEWLIGSAHRLDSVYVCKDVLQLYRRHHTNASKAIYNNANVRLWKRIVKFLEIVKIHRIVIHKEFLKSTMLYSRITHDISEKEIFSTHSLQEFKDHIELIKSRVEFVDRPFVLKVIFFYSHWKRHGSKRALLDILSI